MLTRSAGGKGVVAESGADAGVLVGGNTHTNARAADEYPPLSLVALYVVTYADGEIRIINRGVRTGAPV